MGKILSIDSYDVTKEMMDISAKNPDTEMAIAGGGKVLSDSRFALKHVLEYVGADKQQGHVSMTAAVQEKTQNKILQKGHDPIAKGHQHLKKYGHVHDFSKQDTSTIKQQQEPIHILLQRLENGDVRMKAVDTHMQPVKLIIKGKSMDIATVLSDGNKVEKYKTVES